MILFDFKAGVEMQEWQIVNDSVIGGASIGQFVSAENGAAAVFSGHISLVNSGGFASVHCRRRLFNVAPFAGLSVRVRGDGRRYRLAFRIMPEFDYVHYQSVMETRAGEWLEPQFAFPDFLPMLRGRVMTDPPTPDLARLASVGFVIGDRQEGPFHLECEWIKAFGQCPTRPA